MLGGGDCDISDHASRTESVHGISFPVFVSLIAWNMCENLHYESVYFNRPRILLTDNIQNGGSCGVNYTLGARGFSCAVSGFGQVLKK